MSKPLTFSCGEVSANANQKTTNVIFTRNIGEVNYYGTEAEYDLVKKD